MGNSASRWDLLISSRTVTGNNLKFYCQKNSFSFSSVAWDCVNYLYPYIHKYLESFQIIFEVLDQEINMCA